MDIKVVEYIREDGTSPWQTWFDGLDAIAAAKITVARARMALGNLSSIKWFRGIGEYRIDWGRVIASIWHRMEKNWSYFLAAAARKTRKQP